MCPRVDACFDVECPSDGPRERDRGLDDSDNSAFAGDDCVRDVGRGDRALDGVWDVCRLRWERVMVDRGGRVVSWKT